MGVKIEHKTLRNELPAIQKQIGLANGAGVEVGVFGGEAAWLAAIHEYGCTIQTTPKQRRFLAKQGLKVGSVIKIPERSFLRAGYDQNRDAVVKKTAQIMANVTTGKTTARGLRQAVGEDLAGRIKEYAINLDSPQNHPFTIEQKGSSNPLVDTGGMIGSISWRYAK